LFTKKKKKKKKHEIERLYSVRRRYCGLVVVLDIPRSQNVDKFRSLMLDFALLHFLGNETGVAIVPFGFCVV